MTAPASDLDSIALRRGDASDYGRVAALCEAVYGESRPAANIRWMYEQNPAGACELWLAEDLATGQLVSTRPLFPWRVRAAGHELVVTQAGDAMTHPAYRGRGIFSALVRAAWRSMGDAGVPFSFSFSQPGSVAVYRKTRVGDGTSAGSHEPLRLRRLAYVLSPRRPSRRRRVWPALRGAARTVVRTLQRARLVRSPFERVERVSRFDAEYDALWARTAGDERVLTVRDSRYLNWRYIDAPSAGYRAIAVRTRGVLDGYAVVALAPTRDGTIVDLFAPPGAPSRRVLRGTLAALLDADCERVSAWVVERGPAERALQRFGFVRRGDSTAFVVHVHRDHRATAAALDAARWHLWLGDRDVEQAASR